MDAKEVEKLVATAWNAVIKAGVPEHAQVAAFERALDLLAGKPVQPVALGGGTNGSNDADNEGGTPAGDDVASKVAAALNLTVDQAHELCNIGPVSATADVPPSALMG